MIQSPLPCPRGDHHTNAKPLHTGTRCWLASATGGEREWVSHCPTAVACQKQCSLVASWGSPQAIRHPTRRHFLRIFTVCVSLVIRQRRLDYSRKSRERRKPPYIYIYVHLSLPQVTPKGTCYCCTKVPCHQASSSPCGYRQNLQQQLSPLPATLRRYPSRRQALLQRRGSTHPHHPHAILILLPTMPGEAVRQAPPLPSPPPPPPFCTTSSVSASSTPCAQEHRERHERTWVLRGRRCSLRARSKVGKLCTAS